MGLPTACALTGSEVFDYKGYLPIMNADGPAPTVLLAAKGYDADFMRENMEKRGGVAIIPAKRCRLIQHRSVPPSLPCATLSNAGSTGSKTPRDLPAAMTKPLTETFA